MALFESRDNEMNKNKVQEGREFGAEQKEKQMEEAEKKMAAKERVEVISKEVKNTKQQINNIIANMQQVVKAVAAIRAQLKVAHDDSSIPSVQRDQKNLEVLKKKLAGLYGEIKDLEGALLAEERKAVAEEHPDWTEEIIKAEAATRVKEILISLGVMT